MIKKLFRRGYLLSYHYLWCVSFRIAVTLLGLQFFFRRGYDPFGLAARFLFYLFFIFIFFYFFYYYYFFFNCSLLGAIFCSPFSCHRRRRRRNRRPVLLDLLLIA